MIIIKWWVGGVHKICSLKNITTDGWVGECMCLCVSVFNVHGAYAESTIQTFIIFFSSSGSTFLLRHFIFFFYLMARFYLSANSTNIFSAVFLCFCCEFFVFLQPFCFVLFRMVHVFCPFPPHEKWTQIVIKTNNFFCFEIGQLSHTQCGVCARVKEN